MGNVSYPYVSYTDQDMKSTIFETDDLKIKKNLWNKTTWPTYDRLINIYETDRDQVVHFSNYYKFSEEALVNGLKSLGCDLDSGEISIAMISSEAKYINPLSCGNKISISLKKINYGKVKIFLTLEFSVENKPHAEVALCFVFIDAALRQSIPIPNLIIYSFENIRNFLPNSQ